MNQDKNRIDALFSVLREGHSDPSDFELDGLQAEALDEAEMQRLRARAEGDECLRQRVNAREAAAARFREHVMPRLLAGDGAGRLDENRQHAQELLHPQHPQCRRRFTRDAWSLGARNAHRGFGGFKGAALALSCVALVVLFSREKPQESEVTRLKGQWAWRIFVRRAGHVFELSDGQALRPHDQLRFTSTNPSPMNVALIARDAAGDVAVYAPFGGAETAAIAAGEDVELPGGIQLDEGLGSELFMFLVCDEPTRLPPVQASLARYFDTMAPKAPPSDIIDGCTLRSRWVKKVADP